MSPRALNTVARGGVACLLCAMCLLGVSACGSDSAAMQRLLGQALHPAKRLHSGRIALSIVLRRQVGAPATVSVAGVFAALAAGQLPRFEVNVSALGGASAQSLGATSTSGRLFVRVGPTSYLAPSALLAQLQQSYRQGAASGASGALGGLGVDPLRWLTNPSRAGTTELDGVRTVHIRATLDAARISADLRRLQAQISALGELAGVAPAPPARALTGGRADVYVGAADHLLRELSVRATGSDALTAVLSLSQLNQPQPLVAPAHARPLSSLLAALSAAKH